jgi:RNA polymerase sigma-70 factor (ECF subfamily)
VLSTSIELAKWVIRAQCGDRHALELLLRSIQTPLRRYLAGLVGADDADDILQDVLLLISRKLYWLEQPELLRAWAFRIASRAAFRHLKKRRRWSEATVDESWLDQIAAPDTPAPDGTLLKLLDSAALSPASRAVLVLHFREEMPLADVAAVLEIPLGTVKSRLAFGLKCLRIRLRQGRVASRPDKTALPDGSPVANHPGGLEDLKNGTRT